MAIQVPVVIAIGVGGVALWWLGKLLGGNSDGSTDATVDDVASSYYDSSPLCDPPPCDD